MFEQKVRVGMGHIGADNLLKPGAAVDFLQNASWFQMDTEKNILAYFAEHGLHMYLVSRQVDVERFPAYGEEFTLRAWIYGCDRRFGLRNTVMYDAAGAVCMATSAMGAFINLQTGRGVKISEEAATLLEPEAPYPMRVLPRKILLPDAEALEFEPVTVAACHIDYFRHMNNARYVDIAASCLPENFKFRRVRMEYKRPATLGQKLLPRLFFDSGKRIVVALDGPNGLCCALEFSSGR